jgi:Mlc titration factor MtfA (ptsG expression regulator)
VVRAEFNRQLDVFLTEKRITPVKTPINREVRMLAAASAVTLTAGWPGYTWDQLSEILVYPHNFDEDYRFDTGHRSDGFERADRPVSLGAAHPWGVILSIPALERSFTDGGHHVGIHEFAHLLDLARSSFDGIPSYLSDESVRRWLAILEHEQKTLEQGDSLLDPYGLSNPPELFAVAVEAFFQNPVALATSHAELYTFLATYFCQDPAVWSATTAGDSVLSQDDQKH